MSTISNLKQRHPKTYFLISAILFVWCAFILSLVLWISYFYFYPDNFNKYEKEYNLIANYVLNKRIDWIIDIDVKSQNWCIGVLKCDCLQKKCIIEWRDLYEYMQELRIKELYIQPSIQPDFSGMVTFTPQKRFWSATEMEYNFYKDWYDYLNNKEYPFYTHRSGGYVYDKKINNDWSITRPWYIRSYYFNIYRY